MNENNSWVAPEIKELGNAEKLVKSVDSPGSGDSNFPINLASA